MDGKPVTNNEVEKVVDELRGYFLAYKYNILNFNCNTFADTLIRRLFDNQKYSPGWVTRLQRLGNLFSCCVPWKYTCQGTPEG